MEEAKIEHLKGLSVISATKHIMSKYSLNHEDAYKKLLNSVRSADNVNQAMFEVTDFYLKVSDLDVI